LARGDEKGPAIAKSCGTALEFLFLSRKAKKKKSILLGVRERRLCSTIREKKQALADDGREGKNFHVWRVPAFRKGREKKRRVWSVSAEEERKKREH